MGEAGEELTWGLRHGSVGEQRVSLPFAVTCHTAFRPPRFSGTPAGDKTKPQQKRRLTGARLRGFCFRSRGLSQRPLCWPALCPQGKVGRQRDKTFPKLTWPENPFLEELLLLAVTLGNVAFAVGSGSRLQGSRYEGLGRMEASQSPLPNPTTACSSLPTVTPAALL